MSPVYGDPEEPERLNQGDLLANVPFVGQDSRDLSKVTEMLGVVTSNSCDCDKFFRARELGINEEIEATWPISVAPAHPPELLTGGQAGDARNGRMPRYFPVPEEGDMTELVVDLWREQAVPALTLLTLERAACLSGEHLHRMYIHAWVLRTRIKPEKAFTEEILEP